MGYKAWMSQRPTFSLIVPTRGRKALLRRFLDSLTATATHPETLEVILVVDEDDLESVHFSFSALTLKHVVVSPGLTMGALNMAGYEASSGRYLMLLNDDVVVRTAGWDDTILACLRDFPDDIVLIHVNDTLMQHHLCTFPLVSRTFCELAGGICPRDYLRYRIDDHIEDVFNLLGVLGERRTVYLPEVVFQHDNFVEQQGHHVYLSEPNILARDAPTFLAFFPQRKELALKLLEHIEGRVAETVTAARRRRLERIKDPFSLRTPQRLRVISPREFTSPRAAWPSPGGAWWSA